MKIVRIILWVITILGALMGFAQLMMLESATGAPQQAAGAAMAVASAVVPYVFARAVEKISQK
ncbi:MAG: hypothetical protein QUS13_07980 [Smithella sp.]|nr:hypothetical protein [Smithella sp.]